MPYRILHVADPHFSRCHFHHHNDPGRIGRDHADELKNFFVAERPFDAAILSGDFTFQCNEDGFTAARAFIDNLAEIVNPGGIIVIPGNHDIALQKPVTIRRLSLPTEKEEAEKPFRRFLDSVKSHVGVADDFLSTAIRVESAEGPGLVIIGLNSCRVERWDAQGWGYVGADQIWNIGAKLLETARDGDIVIAVVHHNPLPIWDLELPSLAFVPAHRKFSFTLDAGSVLRALADLGVGLVLHGHTHIESVKRVEGYGCHERANSPTLVLGSGSLGLLGNFGDPPHHFQTIELQHDLRLDWKDWNALHYPVRNSKRTWMPSGIKKHGMMHVEWNSKSAERILHDLSPAAQQANWIYDCFRSWSKLRAFKLESDNPDRLKVLSVIHEDVRELLPEATLDDVEKAIKHIFRRAPPVELLSKLPLQGHIIRIIKNKNG